MIAWLSKGRVIEDVPGVRVMHGNGSLQFLPFPPSAYTASVHAAAYSCRASSPAGAIVSRPVRIRAG